MSAKNATSYKTHIIEPVYNVSNQRAEFRLQPDTCYFGDLRLLDVGGFGAVRTNANAILGCECPIRAIHLQDGGVTLDSINDYPAWRSMQKMMVDNDGAISVGRYTSKNGIGYIVTGDMDTVPAAYGQNQDIVVANAPESQIGTTAATTDRAWISLKAVFPFLASSNILPTNVFRQLKVVIEFNSQTQMVELVASRATDISSTRPLMVADELEDSPLKMEAMKSYKGVRWMGVVQDSWQLDAVTAGSQSQTQKLRGFDGMHLHDLVVKLTPQTTPQTGGGANLPFGALGSVAMANGNMQVRANGANVLPGAGVAGKMRALALATDSLGPMCVTPFQVFLGSTWNQNGHGLSVIDTLGQFAPFAVDVEQYIEDLQVTIGRDFRANNAAITNALTVNCFGRVAKAVVMGEGGEYTVLNA